MHNLTLINKNSESKFQTFLDNELFLDGKYQIGLTGLTLSTQFLVDVGQINLEFEKHLNLDDVFQEIQDQEKKTKILTKQRKETLVREIQSCFDLQILNRLTDRLFDEEWLEIVNSPKMLVITNFELIIENGLNFEEYFTYFKGIFENFRFIKIKKIEKNFQNPQICLEFNYPIKSVQLTTNYPKNIILKDSFNIILTDLNFIKYLEISTNIIEANKIVRNDQILRRFPIEPKKYSEITFEHPQFYPINMTYLNKIDIEIRDQNRILVKFKSFHDTILNIALRKK